MRYAINFLGNGVCVQFNVGQSLHMMGQKNKRRMVTISKGSGVGDVDKFPFKVIPTTIKHVFYNWVFQYIHVKNNQSLWTSSKVMSDTTFPMAVKLGVFRVLYFVEQCPISLCFGNINKIRHTSI